MVWQIVRVELYALLKYKKVLPAVTDRDNKFFHIVIIELRIWRKF